MTPIVQTSKNEGQVPHPVNQKSQTNPNPKGDCHWTIRNTAKQITTYIAKYPYMTMIVCQDATARGRSLLEPHRFKVIYIAVLEVLVHSARSTNASLRSLKSICCASTYDLAW